MSKSQTLRALVNERLAAAAEDIFALFERTIVEYEEELSRSKEENQRKQLLDQVLSPRIELSRANFQIPSMSPCPSLKQEITETSLMKEEPKEQSVKQEEEQLPVFILESSTVCTKTEEPSLFQQEHREETQREDISSEPHFHSETDGQTEHSSDTDNNDDWGPSFNHSAAQMETVADGGHYNQVQITDRNDQVFTQNKSAPETTVHSGGMSGAKRKKLLCPYCPKRFRTNQDLQRHIRVHTGEKPYSCSVCDKTFPRKASLNVHIRIHTGEKPYSCAVCKETFSQRAALAYHRKKHLHK